MTELAVFTVPSIERVLFAHTRADVRYDCR